MSLIEFLVILNGLWISVIIGMIVCRREERKEKERLKIEKESANQWKNNFHWRVQ
ncbi:hypothetical protein [Brevibacillus agri]|uniref:hypothetical protein n=1 Tax=Brevibacillus agri TaxID=51101 RepID=UPI0018CF7912|nr:hypothetical protein [Brevibacillus agri]